MSGRSRRATTKAINYAQEQEFSDAEDIFEEEEEEAKPEPVPKRRGRPRKNNVVEYEAPVAEDGLEDDYRSTKPVFTEKGYDPMLPPLRERFDFMPEYELDGSPKIELIVGRRPVDDKNADSSDNDDDEADGEESEEENGGRRGKRGSRTKTKKSPKSSLKESNPHVEYEYLIKYKGRSFLHLDWKTGADLESMGKGPKVMYRRFLKKIVAGTDENLEDPNFDPSYAEPQKIIDESEQEVTLELTDQELVEWEKEREKALAEEEEEEAANEVAIEGVESDENVKDHASLAEMGEEKKEDEKNDDGLEKLFESDIDVKTIPMETLRQIANRDGQYYPKFNDCDNAYRDGYTTEPPKKPRASYIFFQSVMRHFYTKRRPDATQAELMKMIGEAWQKLAEEEQLPFVQLAREEATQFDRERLLLEKAQKPSAMWQPLRRCWMVLNRLSKDGFANIFLEPVDLEGFPDYEELIDHPMDLGTIRTKLEEKKYQAPENFARDMRKVWNNCKIYNQHGSAIWFVADYMSKQFERLYHAWVLEFRERYLRWANPRARPWEHTCRQCDGACGTPDDKMVLCDHCDAMYGMACLTPPLNELPNGIWHCPDCEPKLRTVKGVRMHSAVSEQAARKRAELGDIPKKKMKETMYLVKWAGLGYEFCTWEVKDDIDDALIADYHRLNNMVVDEPPLAEEEVYDFLEKVEHISPALAGGTACIPDLRSQLYAQTRAFQFTKFGANVPDLLCAECGPKTTALAIGARKSSTDHQDPSTLPKAVVECVTDMVYRVARSPQQLGMKSHPSLPPPLTGEYDAVIPITSRGLMMNVGEINGSVAFLGYRQFPDGTKGPSEMRNLIRNAGDKIIAVDGVSTIKLTFQDVILLLRESGKHKYAYMRFLENRYSVCESDLTSVGITGRYAVHELQKKFSGDRKRLIVQRRQDLLDDEVEIAPEEDSDGSAGPSSESDDESDEGSEGEFEPDSEDEELVRKAPSPVEFSSPAKDYTASNVADSAPSNQDPSQTDGDTTTGAGESSAAPVTSSPSKSPGKSRVRTLSRAETTRSLAFRLLDMDIGYSSDEGGDDDCTYFLDGVDNTFTTSGRVNSSLPAIDSNGSATVTRKKKDTSPNKSRNKKSQSEVTSIDPTVYPAKRNEFSGLGSRAKLTAAVSLTSTEPDVGEFERFPLPSQKAIEAKEKAEAEARKTELVAVSATNEREDGSRSKSLNRSTVKVEQVSASTEEVVRVWPNVETAAATLQLPLNEMQQMLKGDYNEDLGDEIGGFLWRYAAAGAEVTAPGGNTRGSKKGKDAFLEFRDKLYDPAEPHMYKNGNRLRDYQVDGLNWLASTWYRRHGCILADEMGLGKTVQIVSYIEHLYRVEKIRRPYLVVVPLSTVEHWRREFQGWTDLICCVYHDRQRVWRDVLREYEWYFEDRPHTADYLKFDVLVTTYDTLISDFDIVGQIPWRVAVVDEAHRLRNVKGKLLECMKEISAKGTLQYGFQSRVLMTGTPLQNNTQELWTLLNFIEPFQFPSLEKFEASFGNIANREQVEALQRAIGPYMLRRVKDDVAKDLPEKSETVIDVELTSIQKQYYRAIFEHNHSFLSMGATRQTAPKLMNIQMELRKCCNHPYLLEGIEQRETERQFNDLMTNGTFEGKSPEERQLLLNEHGYVSTSGKMVLLDKLLPKLRQEGHKVLIFSQMVRMLDLISEYCDFRGFHHERLDGRVRGSERQKAIDRFETEDDSFVFLLSTRAGGVGINLTAADICIIFDSDWNPQNDIQAQARCHRIGQTKDVKIYRLVTSRSFEQEMFDRASKKLGLEQAVLGTFGQDNDDDKPTTEEMEQLLKKGAYALIGDENDEIGNEFIADDIDSILAKRTRTRVVEGAQTASWLNKQGMIVSKSKFTGDSAAATAGVDVNDPLFWQKVMPDFVTPAIMMTKLDELTELVDGARKKRGKGRGRGRKKKAEDIPDNKAEAREEDMANGDTEMNINEANSQQAQDNDTADEDIPADENYIEEAANESDVNATDNDENKSSSGSFQLSRGAQRKVAKFMSDLKSMMEGIFEEADDDSLPQSEKSTCQQLLLTISIKERLFNEEQRKLAKSMLKRLEGDRRRRCRTSLDQASSYSQLGTPDRSGGVREELLILSKHQKRKRRKREEAEQQKSKSFDDEDGEGLVGADGYLHHSDSEADWSDVDDDIYQTKKRNGISEKEARRRRVWASGDDAATAAGRAWPVFPRNVVNKVLSTLLDEAIKYDQSKGGLFSVPVPRDEIPEYYEMIENPMDYGTMKQRLDNGEYRSAQAMQKDFTLIMRNCLQFNEKDSEIVSEARQQALLRPSMLRDAAMKHKLFIAEDGSVLEVYAEKDEDGVGKKKARRKRRKGNTDPNETEDSANDEKKPRKRRMKNEKKAEGKDEQAIEGDTKDEADPSSQKKLRIRISLSNSEAEGKKSKKRKKPLGEGGVIESGNDGGDERTPGGRRKKRKTEKPPAASDKADPTTSSKPKTVQKKRKKKVKTEASDVVEAAAAQSDPGSFYGDVDFWIARANGLNGSFEAARSNLTELGPWRLPISVETRFKQIALDTLGKMDSIDKHSVFAESVSEQEAPGYYDVVKDPMDFAAMRKKVLKGAYGDRQDAAAHLYRDFLLVFDNCALYNERDEEVWKEGARVLGLLPETFAAACSDAALAAKRKK